MKTAAKPRVIEGTSYSDPIAFITAQGFDADKARAVINAYKEFYAKKKGGGDDHWLDWVTSKTGGDEVMAVAIVRLYRKFYGK